ncbi:MAG: GntR family transcriptional regulator [Dactylosporangium sp.]|nr:GntR family transcriptional regulator [Dactylosporangium sp.]NNJ63544.1 GntR family transcriptional regulator [Dactylosporangium sp.]
MPELQQVLPKYLQIANHVRDQILRGDLRPGDEVPSERRIAADWRVARPTAARALEALRLQGFVESRQGSGTYVRDQRQFHRRARERYGRSQETGLIYPPDERAHIAAAEIVNAADHVAEALGIESGAEVVCRQRVTLADDVPVEMSTSWYPAQVAEVAPRLLDKSRIREGTVAYVEQATGRRISHARDEIAARLASEDERAGLAIAEPSAVLVVRHIVYDVMDCPFEFAEALYPPNRWAFGSSYPVDR